MKYLFLGIFFSTHPISQNLLLRKAKKEGPRAKRREQSVPYRST
jgi:hypothetical protein